MMHLRKSSDRGYADHGWLKSFHSFSFAGYHDPQFMGWGNLRVINEDRIAAGRGFGKHGHRDMEIVSYVLSGALAHEDSMGNIESIPPGDVQRMSAGTGVEHSEFNHAPNQETHLLQIWIEPLKKVIASHDGAHDSVRINADATIYAGLFDGAETAKLKIDPARKAYVHLISGQLMVEGQQLQAGDALMVEGEERLTLERGVGAEVLVFELAS
jgi:redox-sensitive bicupin YhaK (pirin superfamily)